MEKAASPAPVAFPDLPKSTWSLVQFRGFGHIIGWVRLCEARIRRPRRPSHVFAARIAFPLHETLCNFLNTVTSKFSRGGRSLEVVEAASTLSFVGLIEPVISVLACD